MEHYIEDNLKTAKAHIAVNEGEVTISVDTESDQHFAFVLTKEDLEVIDFMRKRKRRKNQDND